MKKKLFTLIVSVLALFVAIINKTEYKLPPVNNGNLIRVADGDTILVRGESGEIRLRLYGIDAPELNQNYGATSKKALQKMLSAGTIEYTIIETDQYGRGVALVKTEALDINRQMILEGHAWFYTRHCILNFCDEWRELEQEAQKGKKGLWQSNTPTPPWKHRNN